MAEESEESEESVAILAQALGRSPSARHVRRGRWRRQVIPRTICHCRLFVRGLARCQVMELELLLQPPSFAVLDDHAVLQQEWEGTELL